jgi:purine-binding chemotaxis protein CheW
MHDESVATEAVDLLILELDGGRYGVELGCVREVLRAVLITPLPGAPQVIEGIIDVRGEVVPVYDLRARFALPPRPLNPDDRLVLVWTGTRLAALRCDRSDAITRAPAADVEPAGMLPPKGAAIAGAARLPDGLVLIHDVAAFLDQAEALELETALEAHGRGDGG